MVNEVTRVRLPYIWGGPQPHGLPQVVKEQWYTAPHHAASAVHHVPLHYYPLAVSIMSALTMSLFVVIRWFVSTPDGACLLSGAGLFWALSRRYHFAAAGWPLFQHVVGAFLLGVVCVGAALEMRHYPSHSLLLPLAFSAFFFGGLGCMGYAFMLPKILTDEARMQELQAAGLDESDELEGTVFWPKVKAKREEIASLEATLRRAGPATKWVPVKSTINRADNSLRVTLKPDASQQSPKQSEIAARLQSAKEELWELLEIAYEQLDAFVRAETHPHGQLLKGVKAIFEEIDGEAVPDFADAIGELLCAVEDAIALPTPEEVVEERFYPVHFWTESRKGCEELIIRLQEEAVEIEDDIRTTASEIINLDLPENPDYMDERDTALNIAQQALRFAGEYRMLYGAIIDELLEQRTIGDLNIAPNLA